MKKLAAVLIASAIALSIAFAAPVFHLSRDAKMNLMMKNEVIQLAPSPEYKLAYWHINQTKATFIFQTKDLKDLYEFYDMALGGQGWKDAPMMGMENGIRKDGSYAGTYAIQEYKMSLSVKASMGRVTVHLEVSE